MNIIRTNDDGYHCLVHARAISRRTRSDRRARATPVQVSKELPPIRINVKPMQPVVQVVAHV